MKAQILTISTKGQIALPVNIRKKLSLTAGDKLVVYASGDSILLRVLKLPSLAEFESSLAKAQEWASSVGYKESDVDEIVKAVRKKNRK